MTVSWLRRALLLPAVLSLSACAVMDADECARADWRNLGQRDALAGRTADRLDDRQSACAEHGVVANRELYLAGHRLGTAGYCTAERGRQQGAAGSSPSELCEQAPRELAQTYASGFETGLRNGFCRPRSAYNWALQGRDDPQTCPPDLRLEFDTGWRLGREVLTLRTGADQAAADARRLRRVAADDTLKPEDRQRAAQRAALFDAEELRLRRLLRMAELQALGLPR